MVIIVLATVFQFLPRSHFLLKRVSLFTMDPPSFTLIVRVTKSAFSSNGRTLKDILGKELSAYYDGSGGDENVYNSFFFKVPKEIIDLVSLVGEPGLTLMISETKECDEEPLELPEPECTQV